MTDSHDQNHRFSIVLSQDSVAFKWGTVPQWDVAALTEQAEVRPSAELGPSLSLNIH